MSERNDNPNVDNSESKLGQRNGVAEHLYSEVATAGISGKNIDSTRTNEQRMNLPPIELIASGIIVIPGMVSEGIQRIVEQAIDRVQERLGLKEDQQNDTTAVSPGFEGGIRDADQLPKDNPITKEFLDRLGKAKPTPLPRVEAKDLQSVEQDGPVESIQKPKR